MNQSDLSDFSEVPRNSYLCVITHEPRRRSQLSTVITKIGPPTNKTCIPTSHIHIRTSHPPNPSLTFIHTLKLTTSINKYLPETGSMPIAQSRSWLTSTNAVVVASFLILLAHFVAMTSASTTTRRFPNSATASVSSSSSSIPIEGIKTNGIETATTDTSTIPLPNVEEWPHRPIFLKTGSSTHISGLSPDEALPLGIPFEFETPLFKGKLLVRLRNVKSDEAVGHDAYFDGRNRVMQTVVQGRFKKSISMSDVFVGSIFKEPMSLVPPPFFMRLLNVLFQRIAPGAILDFASPQPKVVTLYAGTAQTISIDAPGTEPDMTAVDLPEHFPGTKTSRFHTANPKPLFRSIAERKRKLSKPEKAGLYTFDTDHVYTMQIYDESMDYGSYNIKLPVYGNFNLSDAIGPQPMSLSAITSSGQVLYDFDVWHESVYRLKTQQRSGVADQ